jgi:hypothetical protein
MNTGDDVSVFSRQGRLGAEICIVNNSGQCVEIGRGVGGGLYGYGVRGVWRHEMMSEVSVDKADRVQKYEDLF